MDHIIKEINRLVDSFDKDIKLMEVCGTHTQMIARYGFRSLLSPRVQFLSGPGCPVCVTGESYIDTVIRILDQYDVTIASFGDLLKVKGENENLLQQKAKGKDIMVIHSPLDMIELAKSNPSREFIFLGVGFETTAPVIALTIQTAYQSNLENLSLLTEIKRMPPILRHILDQTDHQIHGLICPGHVASIEGADYFQFLEREYHLPSAVCGFEALDILKAVYYLLNHIKHTGQESFVNLYQRCVSSRGNEIAKKLIDEIFTISDGYWRGIGTVKDSTYIINEMYSRFDARVRYEVDTRNRSDNISGIAKQAICTCTDILLGRRAPRDCKLFGNPCNPSNPIAPCMVSEEGSCAVAYRYKEAF
jgi:hydrogenase expression/formation protein HypD